MKQLHVRGKVIDCVSFVCDSHEQYGPYAQEQFLKLKEKNPKAAYYMGTYTSADDRNSSALQAADAVVDEIRRALHILWVSGRKNYESNSELSLRDTTCSSYNNKRHWK